MYPNDDPSLHHWHCSEWMLTPWWAFWRPKWYRRIFDGADRGAGWNLQFATDEQRARQTLEERFGP